jgi:hypothetical protein
MLVRVNDEWVNTDAIERIQRLNNNVTNEHSIIVLRGGGQITVSLSADNLAVYINGQLTR